MDYDTIFPHTEDFGVLAREVHSIVDGHAANNNYCWNVTPEDAQRLNTLSKRLFHREFLWLECLPEIGLDIGLTRTDANGCPWYYLRQSSSKV